jgi:hypothetical protein
LLLFCKKNRRLEAILAKSESFKVEKNTFISSFIAKSEKGNNNQEASGWVLLQHLVLDSRYSKFASHNMNPPSFLLTY